MITADSLYAGITTVRPRETGAVAVSARSSTERRAAERWVSTNPSTTRAR